MCSFGPTWKVIPAVGSWDRRSGGVPFALTTTTRPVHILLDNAASSRLNCAYTIADAALTELDILQTTLKRIHREIADLKKEDLGNITLGPSDDNLFQWKATLPGPEGSVYEGGVFNVDIILGHDYPYVRDSCYFTTR